MCVSCLTLRGKNKKQQFNLLNPSFRLQHTTNITTLLISITHLDFKAADSLPVAPCQEVPGRVIGSTGNSHERSDNMSADEQSLVFFSVFIHSILDVVGSFRLLFSRTGCLRMINFITYRKVSSSISCLY